MNVRGIAYRHFGFLSLDRADGLRFTWLEVSPNCGLALQLINWGDDDHWTLNVQFIYLNIFLRLPFLPHRTPTPMQMGDHWGFSWRWGSAWGHCIHFNWCQKVKIVHLPWAWEWERTSYLLTNGQWADETREIRAEMRILSGAHASYEYYRDLPKWTEAYPYKYLLRSGEVQETVATIRVMEMEHRRRFLRWTRFGRKIWRYIDVEFASEVGERSGSWKGGTIGCSYTLRPDELPRVALKRMEQERKF